MQEIHADKVLMIAIGNNDYISYNKLFDRYYGRLCQYVYSLLMDRNDAEDVVQELFLNLWKNRGRIEIKENVSGYLYRMAKHLALNFIRSKVQTGSLSENQDLLLLSYEMYKEIHIKLSSWLYPERGKKPVTGSYDTLIENLTTLKSDLERNRLLSGAKNF